MNLETLKAEFQKLSPEDQQAFREYALALTRETEEEIDPEILEAWIHETRKRVQNYREGEAVFYDSEEVISELRAEHGL